MMKYLVTALIVALTGTSAWLWQSLGRERERSDRLQAEVASLRRSGHPALELPATATSPPLKFPKRHANEESVVGPRIGFVSSGGESSLEGTGGGTANADFFEALLASQYAGLAQFLDLPQTVVDQLIAIKARETILEIEALPPDLAEGTRETLELKRQQDRLEADREIAALVGESKLQEFREFESTLAERHQVKELRLALLDSSEPLMGDKTERLISALHQERLRFEEELAAMSTAQAAEPQSMEFLATNSEYVLERLAEFERRQLKAAGALLSPGQLKAYREILEAESRMQKMSMEALRSMAEDKQRASGDR